MSRVRVLNDKPVDRRGAFVLYFCQVFRRGADNLALAYAIEQANALGLPCLVYEGLRPDYPFASDRIHTFVLEGAKDTARVLEQRGVAHVFFLPRTPDEARGVLAKVSKRAALIVSDDFPTFIVPAQNAALAKRAHCTYVVVDDCAVVPMAAFAKQEYAARTIRPKMLRALEEHLVPARDPEPAVKPLRHLDLPFEPLDLGAVDIAREVARCDIDHEVPPVEETPGGSRAAEKRLDTFLRRKLASYAEDRNDPSRDGTSGLSPYLHFGMISARRCALEARESGDAETFLEQLLVRRGLAFNYARTCASHAGYDGLPDWAKETLAKHAKDPRPGTVSLAKLENAESPDPLWNAAQRELRARGVIHNYLRMLWGKLVLTWTKDPRQAHAHLVHLNDRWALDGRDPDGYTNISWCFGLHDRPWPESKIFGTVRRMTSGSAMKKLDLEGYLARWGD